MDGSGDGEAEALGCSSKLGWNEADGLGEAEREGNLRLPTERSTISPIAPIIMATTRPANVDFMSYIIQKTPAFVKRYT